MPDVAKVNVDPLVADLLSQAAYTSLPEIGFLQHEADEDLSKLSEVHRTEVTNFKKLIPPGWRVSAQLSVYGSHGDSPDRNNQILTFFNDQEEQCVIAFKGSNTAENFVSDIADNGASQWKCVSQNVATILKALDSLDKEGKYARSLAGHSLGGELVQTCAIVHNMPGNIVNPLPIANQTINSEMWNGEKGLDGFKKAVLNWVQAGNTLTMTHVHGEIAGDYYHDVLHDRFVYTHVLDLPHYVRPTSPDQIPANSLVSPHQAIPVTLIKDAVNLTGSLVRYGLDCLPTTQVARAVDAHLGRTVSNVIVELDGEGRLPPIVQRRSTFLRQLEQQASPAQDTPPSLPDGRRRSEISRDTPQLPHRSPRMQNQNNKRPLEDDSQDPHPPRRTRTVRSRGI
jgi:hypothetical protein